MLSAYAETLREALTGRPDPLLRADPARLTAADLGALLPVAFPITHEHPARGLAASITGAVQHHQPSFNPESFTALLAALVDVAGRNGGWGGDPVLAAAALLRCDGPPPAEASRWARKLIGSTRTPLPYAESTLTALAGSRPARASAEVTAVAALGPAALALLTELAEARSYFSPPPLPDAWERLAELPGYAAFARSALESARDHIVAIHAGRVPFKADAAFSRDEVATLGRAVRVALLRAEPWLLAVLRPLVLGVAVAPTEARTLPSQAVLFEVARAAEEQPTPELLALLREARAVTRHKGVHQQLDRKFAAILRALGDRPEVALHVPALGFNHDGVRLVPVGTHEAVLTLTDTVTLTWRQPPEPTAPPAARRQPSGPTEPTEPTAARRQPSGPTEPTEPIAVRRQPSGPTEPSTVRRQPSEPTVPSAVRRQPTGKVSATVPPAVRRDHPDAVKEVRELVKQVRGHLTTLTRSLESGFAAAHEMPYRVWRTELAANGLAWSVLCHLLWQIPDGEGGHRAVLPSLHAATVVFTGSDGCVVPEPGPDDPVRLWHPLDGSDAEIRAWRDLLTGREVRQPVKQAFREVYRLTPAEEETATYSHRFAAHIVHYKQFYALLKGRGWATTMLGPWDGGDVAEATRVLAGGAWRVTLRHDYRDETADGVACAATDRLWFDRRAGASWRPVPLAEVPPPALSEAMRDVDLFVSVTSIAADPSWFDGHLDQWQQARDYWHRSHNAPLTATAEVRRSALARILPRTKIAGRCTLTDRQLVVRGDLHTYRIHLNSGNILIDPTGAYLCIVPSAKSRPEKLYIPFEDDRLTVILSKAFLLAADTNITDPSITTQLKRDQDGAA
jgi:hypothetical protein